MSALAQQLETSLQYEAALCVAGFCLWVAQELKAGRELPHLTATLPEEWALAAHSLHTEHDFAKTGRLIRLKRETS